jgi:hypothetical protein
VSALPALLPSPADDLRDLVQRRPMIEFREAARLSGWPHRNYRMPRGVRVERIRGRLYLSPSSEVEDRSWYLYRGLDAAPLGPLTWGELVAAAGEER